MRTVLLSGSRWKKAAEIIQNSSQKNPRKDAFRERRPFELTGQLLKKLHGGGKGFVLMCHEKETSVPFFCAVLNDMDFSAAYFVINQPDGDHGQTVVVHDHIPDCLWGIGLAGNFYLYAAVLKSSFK